MGILEPLGHPNQLIWLKQQTGLGRLGGRLWNILNSLLRELKSMWDNYQEMRADNTKNGADKFFHCKANCEATQHGPGGRQAAESLSHLRELYGTHH
uniref:Uncharacterized protein n=1 Tax=Magnetococcus massalia (strain MO-1) TaxID=451514 RepID=A0A1S7LC28_MAGMO|nr:protein of unknown function [Candidatus Magnetococcus massalia]